MGDVNKVEKAGDGFFKKAFNTLTKGGLVVGALYVTKSIYDNVKDNTYQQKDVAQTNVDITATNEAIEQSQSFIQNIDNDFDFLQSGTVSDECADCTDNSSIQQYEELDVY